MPDREKFALTELERLQEQARIERSRTQAKPKVFLSYSTKDSNIALKVSSILTEEGIEHFLDIKDLEWGSELASKISESIESSTHILIVASNTSVNSQWVSFEVGQGIALKKVILPYLTISPSLLSGYLAQFRSVSTLEEMKSYFSSFAIDPLDIRNFLSEAIGSLGSESYVSMQGDGIECRIKIIHIRGVCVWESEIYFSSGEIRKVSSYTDSSTQSHQLPDESWLASAEFYCTMVKTLAADQSSSSSRL